VVVTNHQGRTSKTWQRQRTKDTLCLQSVVQWPLASAPLASSASASSSSGRNRYDSLVPILADFGCGLVSGKNNYSYTIRNRRFLLQKINIRIYMCVCTMYMGYLLITIASSPTRY
jgi:hypothetical protein